ncbi:MAG: nucleoside transporter rane protein [Clostridiales bacterium]|jgi:simple sugar transport system permease protein|nr:nucleoside transporter rane protein [Clostridiales bacterium]
MNDFINALALFLQSAVTMGTPLLLATIGGILAEKVGHLNLGVEGMMLMGAVIGYVTGINTGNPFIAIIAAGLVAALGALIYAFITVSLKGNQIVTGLALTIFGTGFANFIGSSLVGVTLPASVKGALSDFEMPILKDIPILGKMIFSQSIYVYVSLLLALLVWFYIKKTSFGLNMRSVGENPAAADASGINVTLYKYINICLGGFMCGIGGAYLSLVSVPSWQDNITAGIGWIAVALVIFATWNPIRAIFGAYLFGAIQCLDYKLQNVKFNFFGNPFTINAQLLSILPYFMTIIVLIFINIRKKKENQPPAGLGSAYFREER